MSAVKETSKLFKTIFINSHCCYMAKIPLKRCKTPKQSVNQLTV